MHSDTSPNRFYVIASNADDGDLAVFSVRAGTRNAPDDAVNDTITGLSRHPAGDIAMPIAHAPSCNRIFVATRGEHPGIVSFSVDTDDGTLKQVWSTPVAASLAYLQWVPTHSCLIGASYGGHTLGVYDVTRLQSGDGQAAQTVDDFLNAHAVVVSNDGRFVYATSLGSDTVGVFALNRSAHGPCLEQLAFYTPDKGFGPRHLRLSPDESTLYVLSEFRGNVAVYRRDRQNGTLQLTEITPLPRALSHLREGRIRSGGTGAPPPSSDSLSESIWAADIQLTPDGRFAYTTERTASRLITYRIDERTDGVHTLHETGYVQTESQPRGIAIDPSGRFLLACGERSASISLYRIDPASGALALSARAPGGRGANWITIVPATGA